MSDGDGLDRFRTAQEPVFGQVLWELDHGEKRSHWMWFVFPQIDGLGHSPTARHFAIRSLAEARAYMADTTLGPRLRDCTDRVLAIRERSARAIFGTPDDLKFRSSMTLFSAAAPEEPGFKSAIDRYYGGEPDDATLRILARAPS